MSEDMYCTGCPSGKVCKLQTPHGLLFIGFFASLFLVTLYAQSEVPLCILHSKDSVKTKVTCIIILACKK